MARKNKVKISESDWNERYDIQSDAVDKFIDGDAESCRKAFQKLSDWDKDHGLGGFKVPKIIKF